MKKIGFLLAALLLADVFVNGQPQIDPEEMIKMQVERLTEALDLTKDQVPKVETIVRKTSEKMMAMFEDMGPGGDFSEMREKMEKVQEEQTKQMKEILSDEQDKKYDKFLEEQRERMRQMRGGFGN